MEKLTEAQLAEFRAAFHSFDKDKDGKINLRELGVAMRAMGHNPTDIELREMVAELDSDNDNAINFEEFVTLLCNTIHDAETEEKTLEAFKVFDKEGRGVIKVVELKRIMMTLGEPITDEECEALIEICKPEDGVIEYEALVQAIFSSIV
jgi:calmodulin